MNCSVYKNRPKTCGVDFPVDKLDQTLLGVGKVCSYYFVKKVK